LSWAYERPLPGSPVVTGESRYWIALYSVSAVATFGRSVTNDGFWLTSGLWTDRSTAPLRRSQAEKTVRSVVEPPN